MSASTSLTNGHRSNFPTLHWSLSRIIPLALATALRRLALAEQLGRPFRVLINNDLLKVPEIRPYALPVCFDETKEAMTMNMATRHEAVRLLKQGVTIVVFPAGGVATAPKGFGRAEDLPWKIFPAKLVQQAKASVIPVYFGGQNGRFFHLASKVSMTLRISLLIREFRRLSGKAIEVRIGRVIRWEELKPFEDRKRLLEYLYDAVFSLEPRRAEHNQSRGSSPPAGWSAIAAVACAVLGQNFDILIRPATTLKSRW